MTRLSSVFKDSTVTVFTLYIMLASMLPLIALSLATSFTNGLVDESSVNCDRINNCERELESTRDIYFGLMLSFPDPQKRVSFIGAFDDGHDIAPAAYLAVEQINNRSDILRDYNIKLIRADGGCNVTERSVIGINEIYCSCKPIVGIIGPSCGTSSMVISRIAANQHFSLVTIHYGQREFLGNRTLFPFAFGILGAHIVYVEAMVELVRHNSWTRLAVLYSEDDVDIARSRAIQERVNELQGFEIRFATAIYDDHIPLREVRNSFTRVILILGTPEITLRTLCLASRQHMVFPNYQWVFMERIDSDFHNISFLFNGNHYNCSYSEIGNALNGNINLLFGAVGEDYDVQAVRDNGVTFQQYQQEYRRHVNEYKTQFNVTSNEVDWSMGFYDAVWSLALALNDSLEELNMNLTQVKTGSKVIAQTIGKHMVDLDFQGISGRIKFDNETGFNLGTTVNVYQYSQNITSTMVGEYSMNRLTFIREANPTFINAQFKNKHEHVNMTVVVLLLVTTVLIIPLAISLQIINVVYRGCKPIKASSPLLNHLIFAGCYFIQLSAVLYVLTETHEAISSVAGLYLCNLIPWLLTTGTTLIVGTVFVKTWRLHKIYVNSKRLRNISYMSNKLLGGVVIFLVCVDIVVCIIWASVDKLNISQTRVMQLMEDKELPIVIVYESCSSDHILTWIIVLLAPKVVLTLCSFFFALLTRFNIKEFRTKNVVILVYLISILSGVMIPIFAIITILEVEITIRVVILCLFLNLIVYLCVCLLFLPPIYALVKAKYFCRRCQGSLLLTH